MNIKNIIGIAIVLISINSFSQTKIDEKRAELKALKVGFITDELSLTADEATKFWPIYNAFESKQNEIRNKKKKSFNARLDDNAIDKMSDKEANTMLSEMETNEEDLHQNKKKFISNLKGIIPPIKIIKLKKAEDNFNRKLLKQYKNKGKN